jgi:hypothetical protein
MAQLVAVGLPSVLLTVAAIVWQNRRPRTGKSRNRRPSLGTVGDMLAISALPSHDRVAIAAGAAWSLARNGNLRGLKHAHAG